jgi:protoporphyrinogen oxidase
MDDQNKSAKEEVAIIIGAGPAGLTAAYELLQRTDIKPIVLEASAEIGGISRTVNYKGNRMDIGGHRFFSKSERIMKWWLDIMPLQTNPAKDYLLLNRGTVDKNDGRSVDPEKEDDVFLIRDRLSRIFFLKKFFSYPPTLDFKTLSKLGILRVIKIFASYIQTRIFPLPETNLENLYINHFGHELYSIFFEDYTKKLWGIECREISADWGRQRVKGVSITKTIVHAMKKIFGKNSDKKDETSLIEQFYYPKFGPGHLWETVAKKIVALGGEVKGNMKVVGINVKDHDVLSVVIEDTISKERYELTGDYFFSTMPVKDLIVALPAEVVKPEVKKIAAGLLYRDMITVGILASKLEISNETKIKTFNNIIPDTWIYIQEREVKMNRLQIFNNWSPYLIDDLNKIWIGVEYTCNEGDEMWQMTDKEFTDFAITELEKIKIIKREHVIDSKVAKTAKAYPAYFGTYPDFLIIKEFVDSFDNLFLIGRNGMHKYNNMDHSMLTAITAVDNIVKGVKMKENIWSINTEQDYHETKK